MLRIDEVPPGDAPMALLMLADPCEHRIRAYLPRSRCFVASRHALAVGACAVQPREAGAYEIMNIAVQADGQQEGIGSALLRWVVDFFRQAGATQLEVGTGTFGHQLAFYQRQGFRVTGIDRDFFTRNYDQPIVESGIQLRDMLRLTLRYRDDVTGPAPAAVVTLRQDGGQ